MEQKWSFGFDQIRKQTPQFAKWAFRFVLYALAVLNLALNTFTHIPHEVKGDIAIWSIEIAAFVHGLSKMFGIDTGDI